MPDSAYAAFRNFPSDTAGGIIPQSGFRDFHDRVIDRTEEIPANFAGMAGQVMVVNNAQTGCTNVAASAVPVVFFSRIAVGRFQQWDISAAGNLSLNANSHLGACINMSNSSAATITVAINADPALGVADRFICEVRRLSGAGVVTIAAGSGLTLFNVDGHTKVRNGGVVRLKALGGTLYFEGRTE